MNYHVRFNLTLLIIVVISFPLPILHTHSNPLMTAVFLTILFIVHLFVSQLLFFRKRRAIRATELQLLFIFASNLLWLCLFFSIFISRSQFVQSFCPLHPNTIVCLLAMNRKKKFLKSFQPFSVFEEKLLSSQLFMLTIEFYYQLNH